MNLCRGQNEEDWRQRFKDWKRGPRDGQSDDPVLRVGMAGRVSARYLRTDGDLRALRNDPRYAAWLSDWNERLERERAREDAAGPGSSDE